MRHSLESKVDSYIKSKNLLEKGDALVLAVSGGADSVALLRFFLSIQEEYGLHLFCVHIEHGLRKEASLYDASFVKELCHAHGVKCTVVSVGDQIQAMEDTHVSLEEKARIVRYHTLRRERDAWNPSAKIVLAHHADDNAETLLFRLARGTGLSGMKAMTPKSGDLLRPFLCVSRAEIEAYLKELHQDFCVDETNFDVTFARNKIRAEILPRLDEINPRAREHISDTARMISDAMEYVEREADRLLDAAQNDAGELSVETILEAPVFLRHQAYLLWMEQELGGRSNRNKRQIEAIDALLVSHVGANVSLPRGTVVRRGYETIYFSKEKEDSAEEVCVELKKEDLLRRETCVQIHNRSLRFVASSSFDFSLLPRNNYTKWLDCDKMSDRVLVRTMRPGDYLVIDREGHRKKLTRYFIDQKVPAELRSKKLLVCDGSHVMWVVGDRMSTYYQVDEATKQMLQITLDEEREHE